MVNLIYTHTRKLRQLNNITTMIKLGGLVSLKPINEADYVHVGYGKYKEKGKEKDPNAQTFKKDDNDKFTPISSDDKAAKGGVSSAGKDVPKVNIFDKPKKEPKSDKSSEPDYDKYNNKSQTMTDFFKGDLSIDDLQKVAKKNFDSEIASEKDLDGFLNNKFMQDVMADEHGVDKDTLISKVKDLKTAMFGGEKEGPKSNLSPKKVKDDLEDIKGTKSEKLMNSLLKGDKDPQTSLGLGDSQYDSLLKKLAKIGGESEHEEKFRNNNYSTAELEKWAKERVELVSNQSKETPSKEEPKSEPVKDSSGGRAGKPEVNKAVRAKADSFGITPEKLGKEEYQTKMAQAAIEALTDSNFHSEARELVAKLEGKPELAEKPDYPDVRDPKFNEKMSVIKAKYASKYTDDVDNDARELGTTASQEAGWSGDDAVDSIAYTLRMKGFHKLADTIQSVIKENKSTSLNSLLPESLIINEGTRSQVGVIKGGKIISVYVHYDGYPSNMKDGLKKHMKDEKDVMTLIKKGGARGIYDDKDIEYYGNMKPMKGDVKNIDDYVRNAGNEASADYVYLYNTADKKWYYAKTYDDTKLKKLF